MDERCWSRSWVAASDRNRKERSERVCKSAFVVASFAERKRVGEGGRVAVTSGCGCCLDIRDSCHGSARNT